MTIDEQIEYMESEVEWYRSKVDNGRDGWNDAFGYCNSILTTLKEVKQAQETKDKSCTKCTEFYDLKGQECRAKGGPDITRIHNTAVFYCVLWEQKPNKGGE